MKIILLLLVSTTLLAQGDMTFVEDEILSINSLLTNIQVIKTVKAVILFLFFILLLLFSKDLYNKNKFNWLLAIICASLITVYFQYGLLSQFIQGIISGNT